MFLKQLMQAPQPGSRGAQFGSAMGEMAPLLFSMAQGLRSGQGASAYAPQGLAAMMYQQQLADEKADKQRKEREAKASQAAAERMVAESLGMYGGGTGYDENAVRNSAMAANGGPTNAAARAMDLGPQIEETAAAIGMDPVDLATIISYETGGTFDPAKAGPTTQWGQHRGFIQFGEPQARQYGVDWNDPIGSQLGADGAVARYFKENGWQPGMGMLDAYSIVNAGAPGRYSAKDVQNGGAPGTVADKVNTQMAGHRRRAQAMFPQQQKQPRVSPERAAQILANPDVPAAVKNMVAAQFMPQEQEKPQIVKGADGYNYWVAPGQPPQRAVPGIGASDLAKGEEYGLTPQVITDDKGNLRLLQLSKSGKYKILDLPEDYAVQKGLEKIDEGTHFQWYDMTGQKVGQPIPKNLAQAAGEEKAGSQAIDLAGDAYKSLGKVQQNIANLTEVVGLIKRGASTGPLAQHIPNISAASQELVNAQSRLGLDIIGAVTFGALSEGELNLALSTALPVGLQEEDLKNWVVEKVEAQRKLAGYMEEQARFLSKPGNTLNKWLERKPGSSGYAATDYTPQSIMQMSERDLVDVPVEDMSLEQIDALEARWKQIKAEK